MAATVSAPIVVFDNDRGSPTFGARIAQYAYQEAAGIVPVTKSGVWIDLSLNTLLPNARQAEKWEGMTIGPRLAHGGHVLVVGNDNDCSVTQDLGTNVQSDIYVDFAGNFVKCPLDQREGCQLNGAGATDLAVPANFQLIPGGLHSYRISESDLEGYVAPQKQ